MSEEKDKFISELIIKLYQTERKVNMLLELLINKGIIEIDEIKDRFDKIDN